MDGYLDNQLMFLGWLSHGMAMPVADADGPFIISEITNKLIFWWTIVSSSFQDFAYCITREIIFSNPAQKLFLLWRRFIDRYVQIVGEGDGVKKAYMDGYLDNQLMLLGWLSHGMAMPVAYADGPFIISEITNKLIFGWTIVSSSFQDFDCWDGVKKVYMDGYLDNQLMLLGWLSHEMALPVVDADGPFIISEITNKLVFGWTIVSSSFQGFAYCGTRELIFSNPAQKFFLLCRFIDRYVHIVGEGEGVKKVYMDGYLDNQLMLLGWLSHGMAMSVADANGPFIISEITNKLVFRWTILSSSFQDFAYCGTCELIFTNRNSLIVVYMDGNLDNQLMFLGSLSHEMALPVADADGPFIISEITNKLVFGWTIVSSSFQDFAYCCTHELIFSNPDQKLFLLCRWLSHGMAMPLFLLWRRFIDRYVQIVGEGDGVKKAYMDGYLDNQVMLLGWLSHGMAMPVAYADGPFIISEITNKLIFGWTIVSSSFQDFACWDGVKKVYMDGYLDNQLMLLGWLSHEMALPVVDADGPFIISEITNKLVFGWTIVSSSFQGFAYCGTRELIFSNPAQKFFLLCRFIDRYVHIVGEGEGVKKVYMDGYLDNQLMLLGWLSHGMAMSVADANGPFIISEITNKLVFRWTILSSHGMEIPVADADGPLLYLKLQTNSFFGGLL
ncbi:hypothetical protein CASFOL_022517 [Castilleja foliolosa]|uniref:Uncharacterized protein n=2 Tax=Castilleja foliolosa TaxID=1961234 RepID=A0ABD3CUT5_9LAMI